MLRVHRVLTHDHRTRHNDRTAPTAGKGDGADKKRGVFCRLYSQQENTRTTKYESQNEKIHRAAHSFLLRSRFVDNATATKFNRKKAEAARLGVGTRTLERWMVGHVVPFRRIGRVILFDPAEVDHALATRWRVAAVGETRPDRK